MFILGAICESESQFNCIKQIIDSNIWWIEHKYKKYYDDVRIRILPNSTSKKARIRIFSKTCNKKLNVVLPLPIKANDLVNSIEAFSKLNILITWISSSGAKWQLNRVNKTIAGIQTVKKLSQREMTILTLLMTDKERKFKALKLQNIFEISHNNKHTLLVQLSKLRKILPDGLKLKSFGIGKDLYYRLEN